MIEALVYLWVLLFYAHGCYVACGWWLYMHKVTYGVVPRGAIHLLWKWTKWPALGNVILLVYFAASPQSNFRAGIETVYLALSWWIFRNAGDDDFKRKLKKMLTEIVQRAGSRLVIVVAKVAH